MSNACIRYANELSEDDALAILVDDLAPECLTVAALWVLAREDEK